MSVQELQTQHDHALNAADAIVSAAERQSRPLTTHEQQIFDGHLRIAGELKPKIAAAKPAPTRGVADAARTIAEARATAGLPRRAAHTEHRKVGGEPVIPTRFSRDYHESFYSYMSGGGRPISAAMYEGSSPLGGYAIPILVNEQAVALAPQDSAVRRLSTVVPTKCDIRTPQVTVRGTVTAKSETSGFTVAVPSLAQFTLSAFMAGVNVQTSYEIAADVDLIKAFVLDDAVAAFSEYEESLFISGSGSGQPQGLIGNVGTGTVAEPDGSGNTVSTAGIRSLMGTLKESYALNASFLMTKATSLVIRASQTQSGLYEPAFTRVGKQDFLFGHEVAYSSAMPAATRGNTPVLFGDFARGYLIGDRGGSALFLKVLDQTDAAQGLMDYLIFRRTDGRVRRSEAIQGLTISAS